MINKLCTILPYDGKSTSHKRSYLLPFVPLFGIKQTVQAAVPKVLRPQS